MAYNFQKLQGCARSEPEKSWKARTGPDFKDRTGFNREQVRNVKTGPERCKGVKLKSSTHVGPKCVKFERNAWNGLKTTKNVQEMCTGKPKKLKCSGNRPPKQDQQTNVQETSPHTHKQKQCSLNGQKKTSTKK